MTSQERTLVLEQLKGSHARVLALVSDLRPSQWDFHESSSRWSIADNIEHLVLFERFILRNIATSLEKPGEPEKKELVVPKQALVLGLSASRHVPFASREANLPTNRWPDRAELLSQLCLVHQSIVVFADGTHADLHTHFFVHVAWGELDCYQWLLLIGQHTLRHALQIEQVMADFGYPAF